MICPFTRTHLLGGWSSRLASSMLATMASNIAYVYHHVPTHSCSGRRVADFGSHLSGFRMPRAQALSARFRSSCAAALPRRVPCCGARRQSALLVPRQVRQMADKVVRDLLSDPRRGCTSSYRVWWALQVRRRRNRGDGPATNMRRPAGVGAFLGYLRYAHGFGNRTRGLPLCRLPACAPSSRSWWRSAVSRERQ